MEDYPKSGQCTFDTAATLDAVTTDNGHLVVSAALSRPGIFEYLASEIKSQWPDCAEVQAYPNDAILRAYRPPEELEKPEYLNSFTHIPVTDNHPPVMLHPDTVGGYPMGTSGADVRTVDGLPTASLILWNQKAIDGYRAGKKEISIGAYNRFVWAPGETADGEPYDFEIRDSRGNHIAIVDRGRAGRSVRIFDGAPPAPVEEKRTMKIQINGVTFDLDEQAVEALVVERTASQATIDRLTGERDAAQKKTLTDAEVDALVEKRLTDKRAAEERATRRQAVKDAGHEVEGKSDEYIEGVFAMLPEKSETTDAAPTPPVTPEVTIGGKAATTDTKKQIDAARRRLYR